jgi:glucosamine--fructose-6-phosphate aminotransferase (isomerizing)
MARFLAAESPAVRALVQAIRARSISHVVIAGRGTSDNAGRYAQYLLGAVNGLIAAMAAPSLVSVYRRPPRFGNALVLAISQSGRSPDIVAVLAEARRQGALTAVITNAPDSDLAKEADFVLNLHAGREEAVAATKTYTNSLAAVAVLCATLADDRQMLAALEELPAAVGATLAVNEAVAQAAPRFRAMQRCVVVGRGFNYATAFELALKMKELTYTVAEPYSSADFLHGPLAMVEEGFPVIVVAPSGAMQAELLAFMAIVGRQRAEVVAISDVPEILERATVPLELPRAVDESLSPMTAIVPGQLLALHLAAVRGHDVDAPRTIHKVTETR